MITKEQKEQLLKDFREILQEAKKNPHAGATISTQKTAQTVASTAVDSTITTQQATAVKTLPGNIEELKTRLDNLLDGVNSAYFEANIDDLVLELQKYQGEYKQGEALDVVIEHFLNKVGAALPQASPTDGSLKAADPLSAWVKNALGRLTLPEGSASQAKLQGIGVVAQETYTLTSPRIIKAHSSKSQNYGIAAGASAMLALCSALALGLTWGQKLFVFPTRITTVVGGEQAFVFPNMFRPLLSLGVVAFAAFVTAAVCLRSSYLEQATAEAAVQQEHENAVNAVAR